MKTEAQVQKEMAIINGLMSTFMSIAAVVYLVVVNFYMPLDASAWTTTFWSIPALAILVMAMWILVKPAKVEF